MSPRDLTASLTVVLIILLQTSTDGRASTQQQSVSARGNGKLSAIHCLLDPDDPKVPCQQSGSGTDYSFNFTGPTNVKLAGTVLIRDTDLGVRVEGVQIVGVIDQNTNVIFWSGTCQVTSDLATLLGKCSGSAQDHGEPGSNDIGEFTYSTGKETGKGVSQFMSGGVQID